MIIVFVVDTSASMNQRTSMGLTMLDIAKSAVEYFIKIRGRDIQAIRNDRFFLVTYEDGPAAVRAGWKDSFATFMQELKNLTARDLSLAGPALKRAFDLLNQFRLQTGIDNYGQGRNPWFIEPAIVLHITDGGPLTTMQGIADTLTLPLTTQPGAELTIEPFRWDQRVFSIVLQFPGNNAPAYVDPNPNSAAMCEVTGGKCMSVSSMKALFQSIETIVTRHVSQIGVLLNFELSPRLVQTVNQAVDNNAPLSEAANMVKQMIRATPPMPSGLHRMIFVRPSSLGHWPLPESFLPDQAMTQLPPRSAHPNVWFVPHEGDAHIVENFPFDKYELEPNAFTYFIAGYTRPGTTWTVLMPGSSGSQNSNNNTSFENSSPGEPFGYLKPSSIQGIGGLALFVLPYAFPKLWNLLDELSNVHKMMPNPKWRAEFDRYVASIPQYYIPPLRTALKRWGGPLNLIPDHLDGSLNYTISSYLRKLKQQSKSETDRMASQAALKQQQQQKEGTPAPPAVLPMNLSSLNATKAKPSSSSPSRSFHQTLDRHGSAGGSDQEAESESEVISVSSIGGLSSSSLHLSAFNYSGLIVEESSTTPSGSGHSSAASSHSNTSSSSSSTFRNAFDISRSDLISQLDRMRAHVLHGQSEEVDDGKHSVPVSQMGNYHELLKRREILREIDEDDERKAKMPLFGNPFVRADKIAARLNAAAAAYGGIGAVDEAVEGDVAAAAAGSPKGSQKRPRSPSPRPSPSGGGGPGVNKDGVPKRSAPKPSLPPANQQQQAQSSPQSPPASPLPSSPPSTPPISTSHASAQASTNTAAQQSTSYVRVISPPVPPPSAKLAGTPATQTVTEYVDPNASMPASGPQLRMPQVPSASASPVPTPFPLKPATAPQAATTASSPQSEAETKAAIIRELRKPGKNYQELFRFLVSLRMTTLERKAYIQELKIQAQTFKKSSLIQELEHYEKTLVG